MEEVARHYGSFDVLAAVSRDRLLAVLQMGREEPQPKLGLHLPLGETGPEKFRNIGRN